MIMVMNYNMLNRRVINKTTTSKDFLITNLKQGILLHN